MTSPTTPSDPTQISIPCTIQEEGSEICKPAVLKFKTDQTFPPSRPFQVPGQTEEERRVERQREDAEIIQRVANLKEATAKSLQGGIAQDMPEAKLLSYEDGHRVTSPDIKCDKIDFGGPVDMAEPLMVGGTKMRWQASPIMDGPNRAGGSYPEKATAAPRGQQSESEEARPGFAASARQIGKTESVTARLRRQILESSLYHFRRTTGLEPTHAIHNPRIPNSKEEFECYAQLAPHMYWCDPQTTWYDLPKVSGVSGCCFYLAHRQANNAWIVAQPKSDAHEEWEHLWLWAWTCANEDPDIARRICREAEEREAQRPAPPPPSWLYSATGAGLRPIHDRLHEEKIMGELHDIVNDFIQTVTDWCATTPEAQHLNTPESTTNTAALVRWVAARLSPLKQAEYLKEPFPEPTKLYIGVDWAKGEQMAAGAWDDLNAGADTNKSKTCFHTFKCGRAIAKLSVDNVRKGVVSLLFREIPEGLPPPFDIKHVTVRMPKQLWDKLRELAAISDELQDAIGAPLRDEFGSDYQAALRSNVPWTKLFGYTIDDWNEDNQISFWAVPDYEVPSVHYQHS